VKRDRLCRDYDMAEDDHDCTCGHKRGQHDAFTASCGLCLWCDYYQPKQHTTHLETT
jgi:hypothetical protein